MYNEFEEHGINGCVQNKAMLKYAKNNENWFRHFQDVSKTCEPSNVLFWPTLHIISEHSCREQEKSYQSAVQGILVMRYTIKWLDDGGIETLACTCKLCLGL